MTERTHERTLSLFEKNRFFQGKLMTPRDMTVEQQYHAERLHTLARFALGSGIVHGLDVASVTGSGGELSVTVGPGVAIDGYGRPVQVDRRTTSTLPPPEADTISLYVRHSEQPAESAPVPDAVDGGDGSAVNRAIESFEVTYRAGPPPERERFGGLDLDGIDGTDPAAAARAVAERYHERHRTDLSPPEDPGVFVGTYERAADGTWTGGDDGIRRYAVDQELLFTALIEHLTDGHGGSGNAADAEDDHLATRVDRLETAVSEVERDRDALARHAIRRTLRDRRRRFEALADRIEPHSGTASRLAREIVATGHEPVADGQTFRSSLDGVVGPLEDLAVPLADVCTERSVRRYREAVGQLEASLDDDTSLLAVVDTHDQVCKRADSLAVLVGLLSE